MAFVDGDEVENGDNFKIVATNASALAPLRGKEAEVDVYDSQTQAVNPK